MGWLNKLLVKLGLKKAPKAKRKYVRKTPAVKKPKAKAADAGETPEFKSASWMNGGLDEEPDHASDH